MSLDGSFTFEAAISRFLSRCPKLCSDVKFANLRQKEQPLLEDVVIAVAEPFLHPSYTIPVMGCFRPIVRQILQKVVENLHRVGAFDSDSGEDGEEIGDEDTHVIEFYVKRRRKLKLHELACLSFCRALDMAPFLLKLLLNYFQFAPPPFERLLLMESSNFTKKIDFRIVDIVRISYRLLILESKVFSELWDWSIFLDLVQRTYYSGKEIADPVCSSLLDIRWCAIQILSIVMKASDIIIANFGMGSEEAFMCLLRWEEFLQDTSIEKAGWYLKEAEVTNGTHIIEPSKLYHYIEPLENCLYLPDNDCQRSRKKIVSCGLQLLAGKFFPTTAIKTSIVFILMAVRHKWPVLLYGPPGSGKTALINYLALESGNKVLLIHMDEQMDCKSLIGSYISSEQSGEFKWQPGSLTQALLGGFWVVFEDIDKAPKEMQSIILPLLEGSSSFTTGHGEVISVSENFCLFGTISTSVQEFCLTAEGRISFSSFWRKVMVQAPSRDDMMDIINARYPILSFLSFQLVDTFKQLNSSIPCQIGGIMSAFASDRFSLRDLLKWCKRIEGMSFNLSGLDAPVLYQLIYQEAVDVFAAFLPMSESRSLLIRKIAELCKVSSQGAMPYHLDIPTFHMQQSVLQIGRIHLRCVKKVDFQDRQPFVCFRNALYLLERIACAIKFNEPVLLVGETGTGKTTLVQNLARRLGYPLIVMNLSQQTDVADLLGGYKPTNAQTICMPLYEEFNELFCTTFSKKENETLFRKCEEYILEKKWNKLLHACKKSVEAILKLVSKTRESAIGLKRKRFFSEEKVHRWESFYLRLGCSIKQISLSSPMSFKFVEGAFVTALKSGQWLLLDEVNLAPPEILQRIIGVVDGDQGTLCLAERGDVDNVERHPDFRLFACMNPATDAGKKELPFAFRSRFTEYFVDDVLDDNDLTLFVKQYMDDSNTSAELSNNQHMDECNTTAELSNKIVRFYKAAKYQSEENLQDSANQKPQFSLRSLARALEYTKKAKKSFIFERALYDGFYMFFVSLLDSPSATIMQKLIYSHLLVGSMPPDIPFESYFPRNSTLIDASTSMKNYVLTKSVMEHLKSLARAFYIKRYPVLLQGPTSSGKTSLVQYLASVTGHEFLRINNHEHTDLQEYFGLYRNNSQGRLEFQDGVLVKAVREGYWIVLDELNLAPSDVLEALNRLLDDNRELFVPELQETIQAHKNFMLFATQNPPTVYGGRKILSRAFRNRFLEIHVDEIPNDELTTILEKRCRIPLSYASRMVEVMKDLQLHRQNSKVFAGKHGYITPRDLFRWANRFSVFGKSYEDLAKDGYFLLAERLREENERNVVKDVLEHQLKVTLAIDELYKTGGDDVDAALKAVERPRDIGQLASITWTKSMRRLYFLVERCYRLREPVLLVGDTGGGKTTVCQLLSICLQSRLHILNCHQYTETSDFVGGFHPIRERPTLSSEFRKYIEKIKESHLFDHLSEDIELSSDICEASTTLSYLNNIEAAYKQDPTLYPNVAEDNFVLFETIKSELLELHQKWQTIFIWQDGPLIQAMRDGDLFLVDEISLADDSVLERLNSVLEPERKLLLAEKGGSTPETITAHPNFFILATMNPGGDYGKKELSPALRNRFTEIWVPSVCDTDELKCIALNRLHKPDLTFLVTCMLNFWQWFNVRRAGRILTVRDLLSWISFINTTEKRLGAEQAFLHGAFLVLLDGLSLGTCMIKSEALLLRKSSLHHLIQELKASGLGFSMSHFEMENYGWTDFVKNTVISLANYTLSETQFGIDPFFINKGDDVCKIEGFEFRAPTVRRNVLRVLRAMQLPRPVLLEGSPGVGKTSLVVALAQHSGHTVVRINLSEQTDMMDLLGSDLPVEGVEGMDFSWVDGILLQALKNGYWVLLDELNLAPQSVLEGLNAILDHRAEVYIPELGLTFKCPASFRVFACQNPSSQGGGRKCLPKSFLNRFIKVQVDDLAADDYLFICQSRFPSISSSLLSKLITFNSRLYDDTMIKHKYGQDGSPWEFNLRDVTRSCEIIEGATKNAIHDSFLNVVYLQRMRSAADRREVVKLYEDVFGMSPSIPQSPDVYINPQYLVVGSACVERNRCQPTKTFKNQLNLLPGLLESLEAVTHCVQRRWLCILVGPSSSGKTSLIRLLAQLTGNILNELNLSSGTDVSELLGCFERYESFRNFKTATSQIEHYVNEYFSLGLEKNWNVFVHERKHLFSKWFSFFSSRIHSKSTSSVSTWFAESSSSLDSLVEIINQLQHDLNKFSLPVSYSCADLDKCLRTIRVLQKNWPIRPSAKFEWVPGNLVNAIEHGEWVVLDNANLCNPTVLDRINSLVEPNGSITINECGLVEGKPLLLNAHCRFRMFITIDPKYGEISRAMRNRGMEIFMLQPEPLSGELTAASENIEANCVKRFLTLSGIPLGEMVLAMSEAHLFAKNKAAGICLRVRITLLELARWVQLLQQLIMNGNDPLWSLQLSWEHTYLAVSGELKWRDVVMQGMVLYLSDFQLYKSNPHLGYSLALPGGWPLPYTLKNFVHYSRESHVKQNCLYLEFLGSQFASYSLSRNTISPSQSKDKRFFSAILPVELLYQGLFPDTRKGQKKEKFNLVQANQMLSFAANWTIEQVMENDLDMYIGWFKWYHIKLQPFCCFFKSLYTNLEKENVHPIWTCIRDCRKKLLAHHEVNIDIQPIPLLSLKLANFPILDSDMLDSQDLLSSQQRLISAIHCVSILRRTFQQWDTEMTFLPNGDLFKCAMQRILFSLEHLEGEILKLIVNFNELFYDYLYLVELHILFWENIKSSHLEHLSIIWCWIKKKVKKFQSIFPEAVGTFLVEGLNLESVTGWKFDSAVPTLWSQGGHPFMPSTADVFFKLVQITNFCERNWQIPRASKDIYRDRETQLKVIISINTDLKRLTTEGVSMAKYIATSNSRHDAKYPEELDEIYQGILSRFEHERKCLDSTSMSAQNLNAPAGISESTCCNFPQDMLCRESCFDSWLAVLLLLNRRSLSLDISLLLKLSDSTLFDAVKACDVGKKLSSNTLVDAVEACEPCITGLLQQALDYSLNHSSRSPIDFSPHQTFLWMFDARISVNSVHLKFSSLILEMWFNWHSSLWNCFSERVSYPQIKGSACELFPSRSQILNIVLQGGISIKDYDVRCLKLRVTSRALWQDAPLQSCLMDVLFSSANCLFKQILFTHEKYFEKNNFASLKSILSELTCRVARHGELQKLRKLILTSEHPLFSSLMESVIQPLLDVLYNGWSSNAGSNGLGQVWLHIGILRFHLLLYPDGSDPVVKSILKNSWILQRMSLLELEKKVRRECELLSGKSTDRVDERFRETREKLEMEEKRAREKVVFRPEPSKYNELKLACSDFLKFIAPCTSLLKNSSCNAEIGLIEKAKNWQVTAESFITALSKDFAEYMDLVQPIQVAVFEMKLGVFLVTSDIAERNYTKNNEIDKIDNILSIDNIYDPVVSLMQFPKVLLIKPSLITLKNFAGLKIKACENKGCERLQILDKNLLDTLIDISSKISSVRDISYLHQQSMVCHVTLLHVAHNICNSMVMDKGSFLLLDDIFQRFSNLWMSMKSKEKASVAKEEEAQHYKFRPRSVILDDVASFGILESDEKLSSAEQELLMEQELSKIKKPSKEIDDVEEEWNLIPESILSSLVQVHNQLFGSENLFKSPGVCVMTDQERLLYFMDSYTLGTTIIEGIQSFNLNSADDLLPEHLLRVCLEYELSTGRKTSHSYDVYKNSNAEALFKMVEPLTIIKNKVKSFLEEWPDHLDLMRVMKIIETLLEIPTCTSLSKALLGLEILVREVQNLQKRDSRYLQIEIQLIYAIVSSWLKLEVDSWTTLLDGVSKKHEVNAAKLWFPLYGVLCHNLNGDEDANNAGNMLTIRSVEECVEEFILTSSVGEFKKRLQLLLAFHGQLKDGVHLQIYSSPHVEENLKILYNSFGYYVQFFPRVLERIEACKGSIEKELKEQVRLSSWEHPYSQSSLENFRKRQRQIWKLIQKFNDVLQEPVMVVLTEESKLKREEDPSWLMKDISVNGNLLELHFPIDLAKLANAERFLWFVDWKSKVSATFQNLYYERDRGNISFECLDKNFKMGWDDGWNAIERICRNAASFSHIWKHETRNLMKRRALSDLLNAFEKCGLSRHGLVDLQELNLGLPSSSFLQASFEVGHLLEGQSLSADGISDFPSKFAEHSDKICHNLWATANKFYFRNLSMIHQLHESRQSFSKDLVLEQVDQIVSYMEHLIVVQRDQRSIAYSISGHFIKLRQLCHSLGTIGVHSCLSPHQYLIMKHMWQQKNIFDSLVAFLKDMHIWLVTVQKSHVNACNKFRDEADSLSAVVDKFIPLFMQSKDELDRYLLGNSSVISISNTGMPSIVSIQMEHSVRHNFHIINALEEDVAALSKQKGYSDSVKESLLNRLRKIISEGKEKIAAFNIAVVASNQSVCDDHSVNRWNAVFAEAFERTNNALVEVFAKIDSSHAGLYSTDILSAEDITKWKKIFGSFMERMHLDIIYDGLVDSITAAYHLVECAGIQKPELCSQVGRQLKHLHLLLELLLEFSESVLFEFLKAHGTIAEMTNVLGEIFILLLSKGFGTAEDQTEKTVQGTQDCCGTGMGEGDGTNDVSDQIEDETQLTGPAEKDVPDSSDKLPSDKDKGIEMDEDFAADAFSVSEDSEDGVNEDDGEDVNIESRMGETGDRSEIVDEKIWDEKDDMKPEDSIEKYESGPSVEDMDTSGRELRSKEEDAPSVEEGDKFDNNECDGPTEEQKDASDNENNASDDMMLDKSTAYEDPTGIQTTEKEKYQEDADMEEAQGSDMVEDGDSLPAESDKEMEDGDLSNPLDNASDENDTFTEENPDTSSDIKEKPDNENVELEPNKEDYTKSGKSNSVEYSQDQTPCSVESSLELQMCWSDSSNMNNSAVPSSISKDENPNLQFSMPNSSDSSKLAPDQPQPQISQGENARPKHSKVTNPFRSIEQAIETWKEKISVVDDSQQEEPADADHMTEDESAVDYRYVPEGEKSTSQALGSATADQMKSNVDSYKGHEMENGDGMEHDDGIKEVEEHPETKSLQTLNASISSHKHIEESVETETKSDAAFEPLTQSCTDTSSGDIVSFRSSYANETIEPLENGVFDMDQSTSVDEEIYCNLNHKAIAEWKRYEVSTTRLSQELAEQLRLVMEPTVASRLQGDYKTGKRINMKKVIPYIASQFRKDKIWLRRTRPNKRDYQVMIAIDDSRSMSESNCGSVAIEALVTVCRAMSQVEVGQFAVSSFGEKGKIKLLHDFDQSFSGDAGVKIISSLTFKQDNTIADEPVVDLLKYLNSMLDTAVTKARMPSGQNPLHQLILIIADGRFHEKGNLRRCVRNILNTKRMIAFILLDSPQESIIDLMEACFEGQSLTFKKYLDSFPFPFYIVLKNVEELPRTLANLLRQWFELAQSMGE